MHIRYHYRSDPLHMSHPCSEWGHTLALFDIPDSITSIIASCIHHSCRSYGMDFEPSFGGDGTRCPVKRRQRRRTDVLGA